VIPRRKGFEEEKEERRKKVKKVKNVMLPDLFVRTLLSRFKRE
jgi:hypothetical protein